MNNHNHSQFWRAVPDDDTEATPSAITTTATAFFTPSYYTDPTNTMPTGSYPSPAYTNASSSETSPQTTAPPLPPPQLPLPGISALAGYPPHAQPRPYLPVLGSTGSPKLLLGVAHTVPSTPNYAGPHTNMAPLHYPQRFTPYPMNAHHHQHQHHHQHEHRHQRFQTPAGYPMPMHGFLQGPVDRPFGCETCHMRFSRNHDLKRHKRIHLTVKPFPCPACGKGFSRKDALKRHQLVKGCATEERKSDGERKSEEDAAGEVGMQDADSNGGDYGGLSTPEMKTEQMPSPYEEHGGLDPLHLEFPDRY